MTILLIIMDDEYNDDFLGDASLSTPMSLTGSCWATIADVVFVVVATAAATAATAVVMLLEKCISNSLSFQRKVSIRIFIGETME